MTKEEMQALSDMMRGMVREEIGAALQPVVERLEAVETDTRHTRVLVEKQQHQIQLIAEQYGDISAKLDTANDRAAQIEDFRSRLRTVEGIIMQHTALLQGLAKAE